MMGYYYPQQRAVAVVVLMVLFGAITNNNDPASPFFALALLGIPAISTAPTPTVVYFDARGWAEVT